MRMNWKEKVRMMKIQTVESEMSSEWETLRAITEYEIEYEFNYLVTFWCIHTHNIYTNTHIAIINYWKVIVE